MTAGSAVVASCVEAPCLRAAAEDAFVLAGGGERVAASRLVVPLPTISEEEEDRLSIEFVEEIDAETEARLLGEPVQRRMHRARWRASKRDTASSSDVARAADRTLGREGTLEVTDSKSSNAPRDCRDRGRLVRDRAHELGRGARLFGGTVRTPPRTGGEERCSASGERTECVRRAEHRSGLLEDERRRENDERAGTGSDGIRDRR